MNSKAHHANSHALLTIFELSCDSILALLSVLLLYRVVLRHHFRELSRQRRILQRNKQIAQDMDYLSSLIKTNIHIANKGETRR